MLSNSENWYAFACLFLVFLLQHPPAHTWLSTNAHKYETVKRQRDKKENKSEEKEHYFAIYQDRSIYIQFHTKKKKKQQMFLFHILFLCVACSFSPLGIP